VTRELALGSLGIAFLVLRQMAESAQSVGNPPGTGPAVALWNLLAAALVPVLVGLVGALVAQRQPSASPALGGAALGWLGAFISTVVAVLPSPNVEGVLAGLVVVVALSIVGFALATLGGLLGWGLGALAA
jgi:hypothetical protein